MVMKDNVKFYRRQHFIIVGSTKERRFDGTDIRFAAARFARLVNEIERIA